MILDSDFDPIEYVSRDYVASICPKLDLIGIAASRIMAMSRASLRLGWFWELVHAVCPCILTLGANKLLPGSTIQLQGSLEI